MRGVALTAAVLAVALPGGAVLAGSALAGSAPALARSVAARSAAAGATGATGPVAGRFAVIARVSGRVLYTPTGKHAASALGGPVVVPIGTVVDASSGTVRIRSAAPSSSTGVQTGVFSGARVRLEQPPSEPSFLTTTLVLQGGAFGPCHAAPTTVVRRLTAVASGAWSVQGSGATASAYAQARWLTEDTCAGTSVSVQRGTVIVHDRHSGQNVSVPPGQAFTSAAPGTLEARKLGQLFGAGATAPAVVYLGAISCLSSGNCTAAGYGVDPAGNDVPVAVTETNGTWGTASEPSLPANAAPEQGSGLVLTGVACTSPGNCVAVGSYTDSNSNSEPLAIPETAGTWGAGVEVPLPADAATAAAAQSAGLDGVACTGPGNCAATGSYLNGSANREPMIATESNGAWATPAALTLPSNAASPVGQYSPGRLSGIACPAAGACVAVGDYEDAAGSIVPLAAGEIAGIWGAATEVAPPAGSGSGDLTAVSCPSAGSCRAVGSSSTGAGVTTPIVVGQSGGTWGTATGVTLPPVAVSGAGAALAGISCTAAGACVATGTYEGPGEDGTGAAAAGFHPPTGDNDALLVDTEAGGVWSPARNVALPGDAARPETSASFPAVSCASDSTCAAVGSYDLLHGGSAPMTLALPAT